MLSFKSGIDETVFATSGASVYFTGDGAADGNFMAEKNTAYTMFIWYDDGYQGVVRGVRNA